MLHSASARARCPASTSSSTRGLLAESSSLSSASTLPSVLNWGGLGGGLAAAGRALGRRAGREAGLGGRRGWAGGRQGQARAEGSDILWLDEVRGAASPLGRCAWPCCARGAPRACAPAQRVSSSLSSQSGALHPPVRGCSMALPPGGPEPPAALPARRRPLCSSWTRLRFTRHGQETQGASAHIHRAMHRPVSCAIS